MSGEAMRAGRRAVRRPWFLVGGRWPLLAALFSALVLMGLAPVRPAWAATFTVTQTADAADQTPNDGACDVYPATAGDQCSLRAAIQTANALGGSHTVSLPAGAYALSVGGRNEDAAAGGDLDITANITVRSADNAIGTVTIDANQLDRIFDVQNGGTLTVIGLTLTDGNPGTGATTEGRAIEGGAIRSRGTLRLIGSAVTANTAGAGGGIAVTSGTTSMHASFVSGNSAASGFGVGGGISVSASATLQSLASVISSNTSVSHGGGAYSYGTFTATDTAFDGNTSNGDGAGLYVAGGSATLNRVAVVNNQTVGGGAGAGINVRPQHEANVTVDIANTTISGNHAHSSAGGLFLITSISWSVTATLTNVTVGPNTATLSPLTGGVLLGRIWAPLTVSYRNTIFASLCETSAMETPTVNDLGGNLRAPGTGCVGADATLDLQTLADNGGFSETVAIGAASDASDEATTGCPATDQRGAPRGSTCDSGAFERTAGNSPPVISAIPNQTLDEDQPTGPIGFAVADSDTPGGAGLSLSVSGNTSTVVPTGSFTFVGSGANRALRGTPDPDESGSGTVTVQVTDAGSATANSAFTLTYNAVNDAPTFALPGGNPPTVNEDAGAQTVTGFAANMLPGPPTATDESGQTVTFGLTQTGVAGGLTFASAPAINAATGALTYTANPNAAGTATYAVTLADNGGTANGGVNTSPAQTFTITVNGVNDPPANTAPALQVIPANTRLVFTTTAGNAISLTDPDAGDATDLKVTLVIPPGVGFLTRGPSSLTSATGNGTNHLILTGSLVNLNADLQGLMFTPLTNTTGEVTLTIMTSDAGNSGAGSALEDVDIVQIIISNLPILSYTAAGSVLEGDSGTRNLEFIFTLAPASPLTVTVQYSTFRFSSATGGDTCTGHVDYLTTRGGLTFNPGETRKTVSVPVCGDTTPELPEFVQLEIVEIVNAMSGGGGDSLPGEIRDDDAAGLVSFSTDTATVNENGGSVTLTVRRVGPTGWPSSSQGSQQRSSNDRQPAALTPFTVSYATSGGTATEGSDFTRTTGTLSFGANETTKTITVPIRDDAEVEANETFTVTLSNPTSGVEFPNLDTPAVTVTIVDTSSRGSSNPGQDDTDASRKGTKENKDVKETEEQRQNREQTNRSNRDDIATEGNVIAVNLDTNPPTIVIGNRDGLVTIQLQCGDQCPTIRPGDYVEVDGTKVTEQLYEAEQVTVTR